MGGTKRSSKQAGRAARVAWLGISVLQSVGAGRGVTVAPISGGPAANAGLKSGDVVEVIAGRKVKSGQELEAMVGASTPGQAVDLRVHRGGQALTLHVVMGSRPAQAPR